MYNIRKGYKKMIMEKNIEQRELKRTITFIKLTAKFNFMENFPNREDGKFPQQGSWKRKKPVSVSRLADPYFREELRESVCLIGFVIAAKYRFLQPQLHRFSAEA